ncbi:MAG TPA: glycosyltransferase family 2 protein [Anaeromyxobacteraceae bacterium]|nr:glycosyltransferase family 2 protein [Anaeromyxobacteraceae bacterium]
MPRLSAVLITLDEEQDIGRALDAVAFADEIVVVDSGSTDRTVQICQARGARVLSRPFDGFGPQKRYAVAQASNDWVLCVDADEVVTPELAAAIRALLGAGEPPLAAYEFSFLTYLMGSPLAHGATARKAHVRLFDRRRARWTDARVHESVEADGPVGRLRGQVHHHTARDLSDFIRKLDAYTTEAAQAIHARGERRSPLATALTGAFHFLRLWILRGNFLNGAPGLAFSMLAAWASMVKYLKVDELRAMEPTAPRPALRARPQGVTP